MPFEIKVMWKWIVNTFLKRNILTKGNKDDELANSLSAPDGDKNGKQLAYSSLSPIDDIKDEDGYVKALEWAIQNRKKEDIKNIALTGPYGSGKSSVLKTFQKNYKAQTKPWYSLLTSFNSQKLHFLNISLATFKEEKDSEEKKEKEELLRQIEVSILQQVFYHEKDKNIPDSRFKRIISYSREKLTIITLCSLLFIIALTNLIIPDFVQSIFKDFPFTSTIIDIKHYGSVLIVVLGLGVLFFKSIRIISSITINKLAFQNAEIGIEGSKSILNHHLDEILYFFRVRPYNVVIIEDLDRFEETEIFTKLREVNLLLNSSKKTKGKDIVFIYAVRDDMFSDNERIKFFDFIIPIIPVINSYNSSEILLKKKKKYKYELSDDFIEDISYFIDDMRLLHNISNEFFLYKNKLDDTLNQDKLFAIITYKNIYPNDFVELSKNKGNLFDVFNSKIDYIAPELERINQEILKLTEEINNIESINIKSIKELRLLYILRTIEKLDNFTSFKINNDIITIDQLAQDNAFFYLREGTLSFSKIDTSLYSRRSELTQKIDILFSDTENLVDQKKSYNQREKEILDNKANRTNGLRSKIRKLERKKIEIKGAKLSEFINARSLEIEVDEDPGEGLIHILLRNGYIEEDYLDYVSIFHEGSIARSDHKFVLSIKNRQSLGYDYGLNKIENLIKKISLNDFGTEFVYNHDLLNFLLQQDDSYPEQIDLFFSKLKDESESSISFFKSFTEVSIIPPFL